ncbi:uncharacterized protein SPSK_09620 [Sporothrix schenckii 1099-18]|uniref:Uncharacterized protein n=1 Tax=Sporothrix schenckii 1099-18 TaxID=1397361 RepID=A0A0F2M8Q0_SPOSC|nr:uncharacterized protein SPSK_09620 [Sporothrix schenckii 1099-18]KJR86007.1 hypothetical protein SPSK_09620 [Sporothrix schenckii 1099-18]
MGRSETSGFRGYLVRVQTKQGRVYRHRNLRLVLDKSKSHGLSLQTHRLSDHHEGITSHEAGDLGNSSSTDGLPAVAWRSYASKDGGKKAASGRHIGGHYTMLEETSLDEFVQLAHANPTKLPPGESSGVHVVARDAASLDDDEQVAKLYSLGILYDSPNPNAADHAAPASGLIDGPPPTTGDAASAYQADSLDTIRHAEPLYTVRHVAAKRKGRRVVGHSAATSPLKTSASETAEAGVRPAAQDDDGDDRVTPLYALNGVWEDAEGQTIDGRALFSDLEEFEYVVLADDDLASLAGSWVDLESVPDTDDGK